MLKLSIHPGLMKIQRLFIACALPDNIREEVSRIRAVMRLLFPQGVDWIDPADFHITFIFLGQLTQGQQALIEQIIESSIQEIGPVQLDFSLDTLDGFPDAEHPRVAMVRVIDKSGVATALQQRLETAVHTAGIATEVRPWEPHITIARIKKITTLHRIPPIAVRPCDWTVNSIELMGSSVKHTGPKYMKVKQFAIV